MRRGQYFSVVIGNSLMGGASEYSTTGIADGFSAARDVGLGANQYRGNRGEYPESGARVQ